MDFKEVRRLFPITRRYLYFDASALSPYCTPVINAQQKFDEQRRSGGSLYWDEWDEGIEDCRARLAKLINSRRSEVALVKNTSEGVNLVALLLDWERGDNVVVTDVDFPANVYPFLNQRSRGVEVRFIKGEEGITPRQVDELVDERTRLVSLSHVIYRSGYRLDLAGIGRICRKKGIHFHVDATQSLGAMRVDVRRMNIDFLSAAGYKWLLSPSGSGLFYIRKELLGMESPVLGWRSVKKPEAFDSRNYELADSARRFELGNYDTSAILGMRAALELLAKIGKSRVEKRVLGLSSMLLDGLRNAGIEVLSDFEEENMSGIVCVRSRAKEEDLLKNKVVATVRDYTRFAAHIYNDEEDVERLVGVMQKLEK
ncbi:MAG: aminotransferase class V-fold PLP-dependent enzyme [Candidatus Hydrothermarchaeaceae archaeon]